MDPLGQSIIAETAADLASKFVLWAGAKGEHMLRRLTRTTRERFRAVTDLQERDLWNQRLRTVLQEIGNGVVDADAVEFESFEPAAQRFTDDALRSAVESPSEEKRRVLGRLIVRRMESRTESFYELQLREAQEIARDSSFGQLACLATVLLLFHTPLPRLRVEAQAVWFGEALTTAIIALENATWTESDLDHLVREGALWRVEGVGRGRAFTAIQPFGPQLQPRAAKLAGMRNLSITEGENQRPILSGYWLSAAGAVLAAAVLERIINRRVYFPEWEARAHTAASDIIAPFDSEYLARYKDQRGRASEQRMKDVVKRDAEEQMRRSRSRFLRPF